MSEDQIRSIGDDWNAFITSGDIDNIVALYADDAQFLIPGRPAIVGKDAIRSAWEGLLAMPGFGLVLTPQEVIVDGDLAMDRGTYRLSATPPEGTFVDTGKYLVAWQRTADGWRARADMINSDSAPG
jgi:uncharacterized protein (TIGR02246 family)